MDENCIEVKTASFSVETAPKKLVTYGIGSCVVVCFYCPVKKIGALGHFMLPKAPVGYAGADRYVDYSLNRMFIKITHMGINKQDLIISVIGGAQMFKILESPIMNIGQRNIEEVKNWAVKNGLGLSLTDVGGNNGRNVEFDLESGVVKVIKNG